MTEPEEELIPDKGLTDEDIAAIVLGLGITTFFVVSIGLLLCRAEKRRKEAYNLNRKRTSVKPGQVRPKA